MLYFIPAWYQEDSWKENEMGWYQKRRHTEFDDTVKQVQLFHRNGKAPYQIMLLSFAPNFRHFLHRQSVYHASYWSCFDAMLEICTRQMQPFSIRDLKWPEGIEFVYTSYGVLGYVKEQKYASVEFGEDGNLIQVDFFQNGQIIRRNQYDDRGFVASSIVYDKGQPFYEDYLMENGIWKLRHFLKDGHVQVNPKYGMYRIEHQDSVDLFPYMKQSYEGMEDVIQEVLQRYLTYSGEKDAFCVAMHRQNISLLRESLKTKKNILSFFEDRFEVEEASEWEEFICNADYVVTDSVVNREKIQKLYGDKISNIRDITPYDSRIDLGISSQLHVRKILVPVDGLDLRMYKQMIGQIASYLANDPFARVCLFTRDGSQNRKEELLGETRNILEQFGYPTSWIESASLWMEEDESELEDSMLFCVEQCVDELAISKCMREQRVIVDFRSEPELFLQIMAISMGIPQILRVKTQYIEDGKNGCILENVEGIGAKLKFYLDSLENWNGAVVGCYELGKQFTTEVLLDAWKEVWDRIEQS